MDMVRVKELTETIFANGVVEEVSIYGRDLTGSKGSLWLTSGSDFFPHIKAWSYNGEVIEIAFKGCSIAEHFEQALIDLQQYAIDVVEAKGVK